VARDCLFYNEFAILKPERDYGLSPHRDQRSRLYADRRGRQFPPEE
jgi:hypothetical protein